MLSALLTVFSGQKLRCVGSALSPNGLAFSPEGMLSLGLLDQVLHIDKQRQRITVQAGARVQEVGYEIALWFDASLSFRPWTKIDGVISCLHHRCTFQRTALQQQAMCLLRNVSFTWFTQRCSADNLRSRFLSWTVMLSSIYFEAI